ncbi:GtrA family protein [Vagococcus acidifermentans]|uniref:GtrA/DPMS transmembrane domain-containing protein n=1 Tax=Vagococcus acidifermentans TaxID=564710 RepID=A0A430ANI1_9ENTE|nr:GtrA family protein [Vagococcus acidifermentans]RSU09649.1 hypothetical protein CBF27_12225 [Vagococcus acidifermentans]
MKKKAFYRETILYLIFGVLTTVVYFVVRFTVNDMTGSSMIAAVAGQVSAILFAFFTNKMFVFQDRKWSIRALLIQLLAFTTGRLFVFALDLGVTYIAIERYADFFIRLFRFNRIDYQGALFSNSLTAKYIGSPELLNQFVFVLLLQVLAIVINYVVSKFGVFKKKKSVS